MGLFAKLFGRDRLREKKDDEKRPDAFQAMGDTLREADSQVLDWQRKLRVGDFFIRHCEVFGRPLTIYGEIVAPPNPSLYQQPHMKSIVHSKCFSDMCPEGELGDTHRSTFTAVLSRKLFEDAKAKGWPILSEKAASEMKRVMRT